MPPLLLPVCTTPAFWGSGSSAKAFGDQGLLPQSLQGCIHGLAGSILRPTCWCGTLLWDLSNVCTCSFWGSGSILPKLPQGCIHIHGLAGSVLEWADADATLLLHLVRTSGPRGPTFWCGHTPLKSKSDACTQQCLADSIYTALFPSCQKVHFCTIQPPFQWCWNSFSCPQALGSNHGDKKSIMTAYKAFVRSKIEYGGASESHLKKLEKNQQSAVALLRNPDPSLLPPFTGK
mmetsp:Transcript_50116/g.113671  ORF Transcript_50116/g.113671 Transcript_50116/m.113671 type:complete len:233 (-) Transcript_50116:250-948(-)